MKTGTRNKSLLKVLAIDVGTSSVKAGYWDGRRFAETVRVPMTVQLNGLAAELPARDVLAALDEAGRKILRGRAAPDVIAFDVFSSAVVVTGASSRKGDAPILGAITHQDRRSVESANEIVAKFGEKWLLKTVGNLPFPGGIGSSTLRWLRKNSPALKRAAGVGQLSSLIAQHLTGRWVIDPSQACFLGLMDIHTRRWNADICRFVGITQDSLPQIEFADEVLGMTLPDLSRRWGIRTGTPVVGGFVDTSAAVLNTPMTPGQLVHNAGSTDVLALCVERPRPAAHLLTRPVGVGRTIPERWLSVSTIASSGSAIDWARREFFAGMSDAAFSQLMQKTCRQFQPPAQTAGRKTDISCEPWFAGDRTSLIQKRATFSGLTLGTTREQLLAALIAGLVQASAERYQNLSRVHPIGKTIHTMGGATELGAAMRRAWTGKHQFSPIKSDALAGLVKLAEAALDC